MGIFIYFDHVSYKPRTALDAGSANPAATTGSYRIGLIAIQREFNEDGRAGVMLSTTLLGCFSNGPIRQPAELE